MDKLFFLLGILLFLISFFLILFGHQGGASKILTYTFETMVLGTAIYLFRFFKGQR